MKNLTSLFLSQSYQDTWDDYNRLLTKDDFAGWDYIVLTASNQQQAAGFMSQLEERKAAGFLPVKTNFAVIPDPEGKRVGSGGATLGVLRYIAGQEGRNDFSNLRILVIHSGGDSKRVPQYSALGKLFSPVPHRLPNGRPSTLFDEFMIAMSSVPGRIGEGMVLLSGDVLLLFNPLQIDFSGRTAVAISFKENVKTGKNHGVFLNGENGFVKRFLHKQTEGFLRECGAVNENDCVDIDTGAVIFPQNMLNALFGLVCTDGKLDEEKYNSYVNTNVRLSLYGDFLYPLAEESTLEDFYNEKCEGQYCPELKEIRRKLWEALSPFKMKLLRLAPSKFIHFGTTKEILRLMNEEIDAYSHLDWSKNVNSSISGNISGYNSVLSEKAQIGENCYLEVSYVHHRAKIGNNTLLSYIDVHDEIIPDDVVVHGLKQMNGSFVVRIYGIDDNPKSSLEDGATLFGVSLSDFMKYANISEDDLWEGQSHTLWEAALYPECATVKEALKEALNLYKIVCSGMDPKEWLRKKRKSLCSGFNDADSDAIILWNKRMQELVKMDELLKAVINRAPASVATLNFGADSLAPIQEEWLFDRLSEADYMEKMKLHYYIGKALGGAKGDKHIAECFKTIQQAILKETLEEIKYNDKCKIVMDKYTVNLPLRVNFGGGWSDTPPYCNQNGGTVLNASILLNGSRPVEVTLERIDEKKIIFDSRDMDVYGEFETIEPLQLTGDPYDPFALQKSALLACGIIPQKGGNLTEILTRLGGGFVMHSEVTGVPKGSGLGTSSILSGACVKAIFDFCGIGYTEDELYSHVLCMEQIMSTGGGWQDQIGGLAGGVQYCTSKPSLKQEIKVENVNLSKETKQELSQRLALVYTGQRRLARNILRNVVGRYVGAEPDSVYALNEIQRVATIMRFELERGNIDAFAKLMDYHWDLSQKIDSGSTNTLIDQIFASIDDLIDGRLVCGAGGGGFLQIIMKKNVKKDEIHKRLKEIFGDSDIDIWNCELI
ncbi:MAG: bifunctional fucokinase/L-fucose-1-P-guanylyltransferase [Ruminococcaceae bacterium]|nr:bifunctional fucokinase/L-fucose-1-P-guanylyltransferase [Oscillospiraceae bacterium]